MNEGDLNRDVPGMNGWGNSWASLLDTLCFILSLLFLSDSLLSPSTQGALVKSQAGSLPAHPLSDVLAPCWGQEEELRCVSLSYRGMKPRDPQEQDHAGCESSEIKIHTWETAETQP